MEAYRIPVTALLLNSSLNLQRIMLPLLSIFMYLPFVLGKCLFATAVK